MPETRRAAKRRHVAESPLLPPRHLPIGVVGLIVNFLDLPSIVMLAGCNSALRKQVYSCSHEPWSVIDFGTVPSEMAASITDKQLGALLRNCNALESCQIIKLTGCTRLKRGTGLEPLRGSCVLREIDLRLAFGRQEDIGGRSFMTGWPTGPVELDNNYVLPLLSSMPPMAPERTPLQENSPGLSLVKFRIQNRPEEVRRYYALFDPSISEWLQRFHTAVQTQCTKRRLRCGHCNCVLAEKISREDMDVISSSYCEQCKRFTCGLMGDCVFVNDCQHCLLQSCQPMGDPDNVVCPTHIMVFCCESCNEYAGCEACYEGFVCANCFEFYCEANGCSDESVSCDNCLDTFCPECIGAHENECSDGEEN